MDVGLILSIISIIIATPPFIKFIIDSILYFFKKNLHMKITGAEIGKQQSILYLQIQNRSKNPISITNIKLNDKTILLEINKKLQGPFDVMLTGYESKILTLICPDFCEDKKFNIKIYTTRRLKYYKKDFKSIKNIISNIINN